MRSLQAKMFLVFALIATLPLLAMSYLALSETRAALAQEIGSANSDAASAAAGFVDVYVENGRVLLESESRSPTLRQAMQEGDRAGILLSIQALRERSSYDDERIFRSVLALDANGTLLAAYPGEAAETAGEPYRRAAFGLARAQGSTVFLPPPAEGLPVLPIAAPVFVGGELRGVLVADLGLDTLGEALRPFAPDPEQVVFLVDDEGRLLSHPNATLLTDRPDWSGLPPVQAALSREGVGHVEFVDPITGVSYLGAYTRIPRLGWALVDAVPTAEAYEALTRLTAVLVVLSGILAGAILLATVVVARRIVAPVQELTEAAQAVAGGNLGKRIVPRGRDEIAQLGHTFNEMANRIGESLDGLRRSEARYRSLVESANDMIFTIQPDGQLAFASPLTKRLLDGSGGLSGKPAHSFVHEGDRLVFMEAVHRVLDKGEPVLFVPFRLLAGDGSSRTVLTNFSPVFEGDEKPARVLAVAHDVTQERRQELIREKAFQMARLVSEEASLDSLAHRALALLLAVVNLSRGEIHLRVADRLREVATLGAAPQARLGDLARLARRANEERRPVVERRDEDETIAMPLTDQGEVLGAVVLQGRGPVPREDLEVLEALTAQLAVGVRRSIFEARLKQHAAELETRVAERTAELTQKSQEMESFLYSVSHDLKAPLISIQGYAQGLEEDYASLLEGDGAQYLERIRKNAGLMEGLILDILELSRIGRVREETTDVDADALFGDIRARLSDRFAAAGGELRVRGDLPRVRGEPKRLAQLFTNLLENGLKYRHPDRPPLVEVSADVEGREAVFHVRDNGRGIPERFHGQLFKIFQRVPAAGMPDPGGTGMGLAIVQRIAQTHGGRVWLESREGEGSVFHVALPLAGAP